MLLLDGIGELDDAIRAVTAVDSVMLRFTPKNVPTDLLSDGYYLEAEGAKGMVRLYRDPGDGSAAALVSETDRAALENSIKQSGKKTLHIHFQFEPKKTHFLDTGFQNCKFCVPVKGKREAILKVYPRGNSVSSYCCIPFNQYVERPEENWSSSDGQTPGDTSEPGTPIPTAKGSRLMGTITETAGLSEAESGLLTTMRSKFSSFFLHGENSLEVDVTTEAWYNARYVRNINTFEIMTKASRMYGISLREFNALNSWVEDYMVGNDLLTALVQYSLKYLPRHCIQNWRLTILLCENSLAQLPPTTGLCLRSTELSSETLTMLKTGASGIKSKGPAGLYDVQGKSSDACLISEIIIDQLTT